MCPAPNWSPALCSAIRFMNGATFMKLGRAPATTIIFNVFMHSSSPAFHPNDVLEVIHNVLKRRAAITLGRAGLVAPVERNFIPHFIDTANHHQAAFMLEISVDGTELAAENAVDRDAESSGLTVHGSAATDDQIGAPQEVETIDRAPWHDSRPVRKPSRVRVTQQMLLPLVARQQNGARPGNLTKTLHERDEQSIGFGIVIMRLVGRRPDRDDQFIGPQAQLAEQRPIQIGKASW